MPDEPELFVVDRPGPPGAPLVVLVHGTMDRSTSFARAMQLLDGLSVLAYDRRGYARSRHVPAADSMDAHVADLLGLLDGRPATVVGHSYGGDVAIAAACRRPDLVRSVGVYEAPMPWLPTWPGTSAGGAALRAAAEGGDGAAVDVFLRRMLGEEAWMTMPERAKRERRAEGPALVGDMASLRSDRPPFDLDDLDELQVPLVIGVGTRSAEHQRENVRRMVERVAGAELVEFEGASHGGHSSHPEQFAAFVRRAVERAAARPADA